MMRAAPIQGGLVKSLVLLLIAALVARLPKQLAVLLLRHALATLLDDGSHGTYLDRLLATASTRDARDTRT